MILELLREQISLGEDGITEFKADVGKLDSIATTVCAFLNTSGGTVFCGIDDSGTIRGIRNPENQTQEIITYLLGKVTPKALFTVNTEYAHNKAILVIEVPAGQDRPYVFNGSVFVRDGSKTLPADSDTIRSLIELKSVTPLRWERRPSIAMEDADLDTEILEQTIQQAKSIDRFSFSDKLTEIEFLKALALYTPQGFTQAADVLFAKNPALRHPQTRIRVTRFESDKTGSKYIDDRMLEGPLARIVNQAFEILSLNVHKTAAFQPNALHRTEQAAYPLDALREGLVNAVAHRDYSGFSGGVTVSIYPNSIEIWNSGHFPMGIKPADLKRNHPSIPTNPDVSHVLYLRGLMERIGRGGQMIIAACKKHSLPSPKWVDVENGVTLTFFGRAQELEYFNPNVRQSSLLDEMREHDRIRPSEYREHHAQSVTERQARRDLTQLEEAGFLLRIGQGASSTFERTSKAWQNQNRT